jgi:phosphotransferase system enzyme I (PtsI)
VAVSEGAAYGRAFVLDHDEADGIPVYRIEPGDVAGEQQRLVRALNDTADQLEKIKTLATERVGAAQANIFLAQKMMVQDPMLREQMLGLIETERLNAEAVLDRTLDRYESLLSEVDDTYLSERASDIGELRRRVLAALAGSTATLREARLRQLFELDEPRIIVARELTPGETVGLEPDKVLGFVTERGGQASHAAILARALGIPAVSGIPGIHLQVNPGQELLVNGGAGELVLWPSAGTLSMFPASRRKDAPAKPVIPPVPGLQVFANISQAGEVTEAVRQQAEGIGLYRTELEFFLHDRLLSEDEQYTFYASVVEAMQGRPVYIRLLDFGADKHPHFLKMPHEENPCLGYRGARLLQNEPELLRAQSRALARASKHGPVWVMYPMIVDMMQFVILREMFRQHVEDIDAGEIRHGVMFEVPSACLEAEQLLTLADFGSIGSNDLVQYLFAVDRNNERVAYDYNPDRPVFWSLLESMAGAAKRAGKPLSLCGELGSKPEFLPRLMQMGITTVSVSSSLIGLARVTAQRENSMRGSARRDA